LTAADASRTQPRPLQPLQQQWPASQPDRGDFFRPQQSPTFSPIGGVPDSTLKQPMPGSMDE
jgi:hypothetical protein